MHFFFASDFFDSLHKCKIALEIFSLESGRGSPVIVFRQIFEALDLPGQKTAAQRTVWHQTDTELAAYAKNLLFGIACPE